MARASAGPSRDILEAALSGLEAQRQKLDEQIAQLRTILGRRVGRPPKGGAADTYSATGGARTGRQRRTLSPEARKRIAIAQKKRWAAFRKQQQAS